MSLKHGPNRPTDGLIYAMDIYDYRKCNMGVEGTNKHPTTSSGAVGTFYSPRGTSAGVVNVGSQPGPTPVGKFPGTTYDYIFWKPGAEPNYYYNGLEATGLVRTPGFYQSWNGSYTTYAIWVYVLGEDWSAYDANIHMYITGSRGWSHLYDLGQRRKDQTGKEWRLYGRMNHRISTESGGGTEYFAFHRKQFGPEIRALYAGGCVVNTGTSTISYVPTFISNSRTTYGCTHNMVDGSSNAHYNMNYANEDIPWFNGSNSKINTSNLGPMTSSTLSCVFKPFSTTNGGFLMYRCTNMNHTDNSDNLNLYFASDGSLRTNIEFSVSDNDKTLTSDVNVTANTVYHAITTYDHPSRIHTLYVDGRMVKQATYSSETGAPYTSQYGYALGSQAGTNHGGVAADRSFFSGVIFSAEIFNRGLNYSEVMQLFKSKENRY
jgi:hypothetical protein